MLKKCLRDACAVALGVMVGKVILLFMNHALFHEYVSSLPTAFLGGFLGSLIIYIIIELFKKRGKVNNG